MRIGSLGRLSNSSSNNTLPAATSKPRPAEIPQPAAPTAGQWTSAQPPNTKSLRRKNNAAVPTTFAFAVAAVAISPEIAMPALLAVLVPPGTIPREMLLPSTPPTLPLLLP